LKISAGELSIPNKIRTHNHEKPREQVIKTGTEEPKSARGSILVIAGTGTETEAETKCTH
jgi:hypothetical protein